MDVLAGRFHVFWGQDIKQIGMAGPKSDSFQLARMLPILAFRKFCLQKLDCILSALVR